MAIYQFGAPLTGELIEELLLLVNEQKNSRNIVTLTESSGAISVPVAEGGYFKLGCTGPVDLTFDLTGLPSNRVATFDLEVTNGLAGMDFTNTIRWPEDIVPVNIAGTQVLRFYKVSADLFGALLLNDI